MKQCPGPHCDLGLTTVNHQQTNQCPACKGLWVPGPGIDQLLGSGQMLQLRSLRSVLKSDLPCPSGCGQLTEGKVGQVILDLGQNCGGLWLDPGELEALRQRRGITPPTAVNQSRPGQDRGNDILLALSLISW